ncbi:MAG: ATP-binding cassette domain-containing protein [Paludibacteraceae bacterium]|nr:ATP-binding cassette domain-containing protein [Paludibacteraceae bacterium]
MAVQLTHINKSFGRQQVLRDVTLTIPDGQILGLLGPNGAGKSTLMKILIGLWRADSGEVKAPLRIGYLPENNPLYDEMYVAEYLRFMAQMTNDQLPITNVDALIDRVGLTPERHKHIRELSKGYRQRVGLAQALLGDPELLILDEPTTGLDPNQLVEIRALIRDITKSPLTKNEVNRALAAENDQSPMTKSPIVILSTHIMQEVREMCDRVVILNHGEIKADKMIDEITDLEQLFHDSTDSNKSFVL